MLLLASTTLSKSADVGKTKMVVFQLSPILFTRTILGPPKLVLPSSDILPAAVPDRKVHIQLISSY